MTKYEIRFLFDFGSGVCLWGMNDLAKEAFNYPINHWNLPISENAKRWLDYLIAWYDVALDWVDTPDGGPYWSDLESKNFDAAVAKGYQILLNELPANEFVITNGTRPFI